MKLSLIEFLDLSVDEKIKRLNENNIKVHPFVWMLLCDGLKNSISVIHSVVGQKLLTEPPGVLSQEDMKKIIDRCDQLGKTLTKIQNDLVDKVKEEEYG